MTPTTYPDLINRATRLVEDGRPSATIRLDDRESALALVLDSHAVLSALEAHIWALISPGRASGVRSAAHPDTVEAAALQLAAAISETIGVERPHPSLLAGSESAWTEAARTLRAATDLVHLHHDTIGAPRSPVAHILESPEARDAALSRVAALALTTASVEDAQALRIGQAGVHWGSVAKWLTGLHHVVVPAEQLARVTESERPHPLPDVGLITARVRTDDVLAELTDRLARVRQRAWELVNSPGRSVAALRDLATIGVAVHAHAAAFHAGPGGPAGTLIARGRNWQALGSRLAILVSPALRDDVVHADLAGLARLLPTVAPLSGVGRAHLPDPALRRTGAALGGAIAIMTEVADHNARTFAKITRTSTVYAPARSLTGEEITDQPELVRARLEGRLAPASTRQLEEVGHLYQSLRSHPSPRLTPRPALGRDTLDRASDVTAVGLQVDA
ncbi:hypothetical protein N866_00035 [Actinotalea ferrariae CF5-4]|uniref:Uncharacterized protein n=1 Tax=Actinotalea ferrariae CF5-4 TaxID=948458 RepID=A0A021VW03_9CELL|nr:hypothetical protein [Actinotalea ferrariae]EYR65308.1 hypothetical protein N866_00035 [Actinotalea ferrariae CF5-4]